ncbi:MAG TPA: ATP-binding protein, partial [Candidatus Competibacter sp.]|nr:ATP-binding protein [Candidatus Competibacter sp.]
MKSLSAAAAKHGSISRQIAIRMAVGALLVTLLSLSAFGLLDYRDRVQDARRALDEVAQSAAPGIMGSLWAFDMAQLQAVVDGLSLIPSIGHVLVLDEKGAEVARSGRQIDDPERRLEKRVELVYRDSLIESRVGELRVLVDLWPLKVAAAARLLPLMVALLLVVIALGAVFFALFERSVARHLMAISDYLSGMSLERLDKPLALPPTARLDNELGVVVEAINGMRQQILKSHQELEDHRRHLEETVAQRTAELRRQQVFSEAVLDNISDGVVASDETGRLSFFNRAAREMPGIAQDHLLPEQWEDRYKMFHADGETPMVLADIPLFRALQGESVRNAQMVVEQADGSRRNLLVSGQSMLDADGVKIGAVVSLHDITEQKVAEAKLLEAKDAAEAANRAKSLFLANMSHELRTPLNAVLGYAELLLRDAADGRERLSLSQGDYLSTVYRSGEHLLTLINNVLDLSRIEAGRAVVNPKAFDLHELLMGLEGMFAIKASTKGLTLGFEREVAVPRYIRTDEVKLRQMLINLLSNAFKFTRQGGVRVRVSASSPSDAAAMDPAAPGRPLRLTFEVADTGPGIAAEELAGLFQPFAQSASGRKAEEGTGLGLAITRQFAELLGGGIEARSTFGEGSTFAFTILAEALKDADLAPEMEGGPVLGLAPGQPTWRILVADDDANGRQ